MATLQCKMYLRTLPCVDVVEMKLVKNCSLYSSRPIRHLIEVKLTLLRLEHAVDTMEGVFIKEAPN